MEKPLRSEPLFGMGCTYVLCVSPDAPLLIIRRPSYHLFKTLSPSLWQRCINIPHLRSRLLQEDKTGWSVKENSEYGCFGFKVQFWYQQIEIDDLCSFASLNFQTTEFIVMYLSFEEGFELRRSCTEVRRPEFWLREDFVQTRRKSNRKVYIHLVHVLRRYCM